jgi:Arc/MetJ family transcription regulator
LAEAVEAERDDRIAADSAEPGQGHRVEVADGDQRKVGPLVTHTRFTEPSTPGMLRAPDYMCREPHMPTNLSLDPDLLDRALAVSGERTKKAAVTKALQEFIARRQQKRLLELMGKLEWDEGFDYKAERSRR